MTSRFVFAMTDRISLHELSIQITTDDIQKSIEKTLEHIDKQLSLAVRLRETCIDTDISNPAFEYIDVWYNNAIRKQIELETVRLNALSPDTPDENKQSAENKWNPRIMKKYYEIIKERIIHIYASHPNPEMNLEILFYLGTKSGQRVYLNWK